MQYDHQDWCGRAGFNSVASNPATAPILLWTLWPIAWSSKVIACSDLPAMPKQNFTRLHLCTSQHDICKVYDTSLWSNGVAVRSWTFKHGSRKDIVQWVISLVHGFSSLQCFDIFDWLVDRKDDRPVNNKHQQLSWKVLFWPYQL